MNKIVITGGLGFIGSNLINLLIKKGYKIINIDKVSYASNFYNVLDFKKNKNYKFYKVDINNKSKILNILKKYKPLGIFNLAAESHVDRSIDSPKEFINSNILGTFNLLEAFRFYSKINNKCKLIHISTDEVYGDIISGRTNENHAYNPSSPYAASKASSDHLVVSYIKTFGIKAIITNCSNNYGPKQHPEKLIPKMIYNIINNKPLLIYGNGKNSREWIYVKDHCEALIALAKNGRYGHNYNIGSGNNMTNINLTKLIIKIFKKKFNIKHSIKIKYVKDRPGHDFKYSLNLSKTKKTIKLVNRPIIKGLIDTINWYLSNKKYFDKIPTKSFNRRLGLLK